MSKTYSSFEEHQLAFDNWRQFSENDVFNESIEFSLEEILKEIDTLTEAEVKDLTSDKEVLKKATELIVVELSKIPALELNKNPKKHIRSIADKLTSPIQYLIKQYVTTQVKGKNEKVDPVALRDYVIDWLAKVFATSTYYILGKFVGGAAGAAAGAIVPFPFMVPILGAIGTIATATGFAAANWVPQLFTGKTLLDYFKDFSTYQAWAKDAFNYLYTTKWFKKFFEDLERHPETQQQKRIAAKKQFDQARTPYKPSPEGEKVEKSAAKARKQSAWRGSQGIEPDFPLQESQIKRFKLLAGVA
jgi:hypothetical protein